jgi:cell division protein FtsQ
MATGVKGRSSARSRARTSSAGRARRPIDPRMRERRVAIVRAQGRRRLRWLVTILGLGILGAVAWLVTHSTLLDVDHVRVTGTQRVAADDVRRVSGVRRGEPILFIDAGAIERRVERLAWVGEAHVERGLPGELEIRVTERLPALWARRSPATVALLDGRGRVLTDLPEPPEELAEIVGVATLPTPGQHIAPRAAARVVEKLPADLRARVARIAVDGEAVTLVLRDGPELRLGQPERIAAKARAAVAVLGTNTGAPPSYVDVRVPSAPVTG